MIDFTSSLYLGMKHSSIELKSWEQLTTGVPAVLNESPAIRITGEYVANMQGLAKGISAPSTLHLYSDLFGWLSKKNVVLFVDEKIYPVSRYGIEKLSAQGKQVYPFRHFDAGHLERLVKTKTHSSAIPVVMSDGWCPACGRVTPLKEYAAIVKNAKGIIIIDDTQAFGIAGERQENATPYGSGGGGIVKWLNVKDDNIITAVSLAKAFGVPMAVLSGSTALIAAFEENSDTRTHSSPVSMAHVQAALNAFSINEKKGDWLRAALWRNVSLFRNKLRHAGIESTGGIFPVQNIAGRSSADTMRMYNRLKQNSIRTVLTTSHYQRRPLVSFVIRCDHTPGEMAAAVNHITSEIRTRI